MGIVFLVKPEEAMKYFSHVITMENYRDVSRNTLSAHSLLDVSRYILLEVGYGKRKRQRIF